MRGKDYFSLFPATKPTGDKMKKLCTKCNKEKDLSCFHKHKAELDGYNYCCKVCWAKYRKQYRVTNNKIVNEQQKVHYRKNRTRILKEHKRFNQTLKGRLNTYKNGAKRRGIDWNLTFDEFLSFWQNDCYYCNEPIETIGLDRLDPSKGYTLKNLVASCEMCNRMKRDYNFEEFIEKIEKINERLVTNGLCVLYN